MGVTFMVTAHIACQQILNDTGGIETDFSWRNGHHLSPDGQQPNCLPLLQGVWQIHRGYSYMKTLHQHTTELHSSQGLVISRMMTRLGTWQDLQSQSYVECCYSLTCL
jgi:hypothetical protein